MIGWSAIFLQFTVILLLRNTCSGIDLVQQCCFALLLLCDLMLLCHVIALLMHCNSPMRHTPLFRTISFRIYMLSNTQYVPEMTRIVSYRVWARTSICLYLHVISLQASGSCHGGAAASVSGRWPGWYSLRTRNTLASLAESKLNTDDKLKAYLTDIMWIMNRSLVLR